MSNGPLCNSSAGINLFNKIEIDLNFNATKSYCMIFTPWIYNLLIPPLYLNKLPVLFTDSNKYLGFTF